MNFSAWSIRNPVPAILLFLILTVLGLISFNRLGIQNFPDIELPIITINATLEGAAPAQLETEVTRKIEDSLASIDGIKHIHSSITDSLSLTYLEFNVDKDINEALDEVRNEIDSTLVELPSNLDPPIIAKVTTSGMPILTYSVQATNMSEQELSWFVDNSITKAMLSVKGVAKISRIGGITREVLVNLDPSKMQSLGISALEVSNRLAQVQKDAPSGRSDIGESKQSIRVLAAAESIETIANLDIPLNDGRSIYLREIAQIKDHIAERSSIALSNGEPVIAFNITRSKGASEVTVAQAVREAIQQFSTQHPQISIQEIFDRVQPVRDNYDSSMHLLFEGAFLAVVVVWLFLRDWRATFIAATALPLSIIPTFAVMYFAGFSLNVLTLLSLALVVGILVDDAIVEIENIVRHLRMGKSPYQAAMDAADEIGLAVIATTFTLVAVFLPTAFMGGIPGKFFYQFGLTASVAIVASLIVARLLTPMMSAYLLKIHPKKDKDHPILQRYLKLVGWCLRHRKSSISMAMAFFIVSISILPLLPSGFLPSPDLGLTMVSLEMQPGTKLEDSKKTAEHARKLLKDNPNIKYIFSDIGSSLSGSNLGMLDANTQNSSNTSTLTLALTNLHERNMTQSEIETEIRQRLQNLPATRITVGSGNNGEKYQLTLTSDNAAILKSTGEALEKELRQLKGVGNITSSSNLQRPEVQIIPDYEKAADLGITSETIANTVRIATYGDFESILPKLNLSERQLPIRVRFDTSIRNHLDQLAQLHIPSKNGGIPLGTIAEIRLSSSPSEISRIDRLRRLSIDIELNGRSLSEVIKEVNELSTMKNLPPSVKHLSLGDAESMAELFDSFSVAMLIGILSIYTVLVLLFRDFLQPITILVSLPLSLGGAFLALLMTHNSFSMPSIIGILMLMGVVTKNSILLVEYAIMARRTNQSTRLEAIMDACHKRAQPIVMTSIAMIAGMLPIALGFGADPSFRAPMAISVIGGLVTSTFLSLLIIPVVYTYVDDCFIKVRTIIKKH